MHRKLFLVPLLLALLAAPAARAHAGSVAHHLHEGSGGDAAPGRFGLGLGGQTLASGLSAKLYTGGGTAVQFVVGGWGRFGWGLGVDGVVEFSPLARHEGFRLVPYLGAGATIGSWSKNRYYDTVDAIAAAGVGGLALQLRRLPLEFALELRPGLLFEPDGTRFHFGGGGAIRFYF